MKEVFEKAILTYGQTAQEDVAIEEMSELIKAICKIRYKVRRLANRLKEAPACSK